MTRRSSLRETMGPLPAAMLAPLIDAHSPSVEGMLVQLLRSRVYAATRATRNRTKVCRLRSQTRQANFASTCLSASHDDRVPALADRDSIEDHRSRVTKPAVLFGTAGLVHRR